MPGSPSSLKLKDILAKILDKVSDTMKAPVCKTTIPLDLRSQFIRISEVSIIFASWNEG